MKRRPNVLFIIADDHRHDAIGAFGDPVVQTPGLDQLAERGTSFRSTYIMGGLSGAVCVPTRAALHTGASVFRATPAPMDSRAFNTINPRLTLLPETFRANGYRTFATGKWHNDRTSFNRCFADGVNIFFGGMCDQDRVPAHQYDSSGAYPDEARTFAQGFSTELFCDSAIDFLAEQADEDEPFFLYVALTSPHDPRMAPAPFSQMYPAADMPLPPNFAPIHPFDNGDMTLRDEMLTAFPRTQRAVQQHMADYYAMISHQDSQLQRLFDALSTTGLEEETIVVYTSDHGLSVGQHGLMGKQNLYDHSVRIPLIMAGPGLPAGQAINGLTFQIDIFPTLCTLAGLPIPPTVEGESLSSVIANPNAPGRDSIFTVYRDVQRMVTDGAWKLIWYTPSPITGRGTQRIQLFDMQEDPWEVNDLADNSVYDDVKARLTIELTTWQKRSGDWL